jgi:hypothetical protein
MVSFIALAIIGLFLCTPLIYLFFIWRQAVVPDEELYHRIFLQEPGDHWRLNQFSYYHILKALRGIKLTVPLFKAMGWREEEFHDALPILVYVASRVYVTDLNLEQSLQKRESYADTPSLTEDLVRFLSFYGLCDEEISDGVANIQRYFEYESRIMLDQVEITDEQIRDLCFQRGCDIYLLLRVFCKARRPSYSKDYLHLGRCLVALGEIQDDLSSYQKDVRENSMNLLRLCVRKHGAEKGLEKLREFTASIVDEAIGAMKSVDKRHIVHFAAAYIEMESGIPFVMAKLLFAYWPKFVLMIFMRRYVRTAVINTVFADCPQPAPELR